MRSIEYDKYGNVKTRSGYGLGYNILNMLETYADDVYKYDYKNVRLKKTTRRNVTGTEKGLTIDYYYDGSRIIGEDLLVAASSNSIKIRYFYDAEGIAGVRYKNKNYNFLRDALGSVRKVLYKDKVMCEYIYDAWGNCTANVQTEIGADAIFVANNNPFRWKGHYYDAETGFYAIYINGKTRYYDPTLMMFLDAAEITEISPYSIGGLDRNGLGVSNPLLFPANSGNIFSTIDYARGTAGNERGSSGKRRNTSSINWPDLSFLSDGFSWIENGFSILAGTIDGYRKLKGLDKLVELEETSNLLMGIGIALNVGLSFYDNLTQPNLTGTQRAGNIIGDSIYIGVSALTTWAISSIPIIGPFIAFATAYAFDKIWYGDWWKPNGKSIDQHIKDFFTQMFGG